MRVQLLIVALLTSTSLASVLAKRKSCSINDARATCVICGTDSCAGEKPSCHNHVFWFTCYCYDNNSCVQCGTRC
ncbi:hypothetical protein PTTW11_10428 [Pyrenophora teres f. teres]|uniref:Uncharacterized protein n=1 Tax=Pyrenophora teres f. teres TaxID=97479 RepID=A0A6S6WFF6_9PLEO|nr:hypothetical protein PTTW11_10428 [Pyrenophora teres f. teres]